MLGLIFSLVFWVIQSLVWHVNLFLKYQINHPNCVKLLSFQMTENSIKTLRGCKIFKSKKSMKILLLSQWMADEWWTTGFMYIEWKMRGRCAARSTKLKVKSENNTFWCMKGCCEPPQLEYCYDVHPGEQTYPCGSHSPALRSIKCLLFSDTYRIRWECSPDNAFSCSTLNYWILLWLYCPETRKMHNKCYFL